MAPGFRPAAPVAAPGAWILSVVTLLCCNTLAHGLPSSYVAAVYEHRVILNPQPHVTLSRHEALQHMRQNLQVYETQAAIAAAQGAQIIVFPEDGLQGFNFTRVSIRPYLEVVPDPRREIWNPCEQPEQRPDTEVQQWLSCMARRHSLYVVANMGSVQPCDPPDSAPDSSPGSSDSSPDSSGSSHGSSDSAPCPADGRWQFNTNVVFRSDGRLVARYHKQNLYFEAAFDRPPRSELVSFQTPFAGTFGLITCFDILFREPTVALLQAGVRQLVFPTAWMNQLPLLDVIQIQRALSLGANATVLGANIRNHELIMSGSGIFSPTAAVYHHGLEGEAEEGRLVVASLSPLEAEAEEAEEAEEEVVKTLAKAHDPEPHRDQDDTDSGSCPADGCSAPPSFTSTMMHDPFTFVLLSGSRGRLRVCDGSFCCSLSYQHTLTNHTELHALGAFNGLHTVNGNYSLQVCAVVKCAGPEAASCGQEVVQADTRMDFVLEGKFDTRHVFPSVLSSLYRLEQPSSFLSSPQGVFTMSHSNMAAGLVTAALYGRTYHLDPL